MAQKTPREVAFETMRESFKRMSKRDKTNYPTTSAMLIENLEDSLWRNNNEEQDTPEEQVQQNLTPPAQTDNQESDDEKLGLLTQYIEPAIIRICYALNNST